MRRKWLENPGGGISEIQTLAPETEQETTEEKGTEAASTEMPKVRGTETTERQETGSTQRKAKKPVKKKMLPDISSISFSLFFILSFCPQVHSFLVTLLLFDFIRTLDSTKG